MKKKSPRQLEALEKTYAERKYPSTEAIKELATVLKLTLKQVREWFVGRRRRDTSKDTVVLHTRKKLSVSVGSNEVVVTHPPRKLCQRQEVTIPNIVDTDAHAFSKRRCVSPEDKGKLVKRKKMIPPFILKTVFLEDGPPLGVEFDPIPSKMFCNSNGSKIDHAGSCHENQQTTERRKISKPGDRAVPAKKHGIGKGLMTAWRATHPNGQDYPPGFLFSHVESIDIPATSIPCSRKPTRQKKITQKIVSKMNVKRKIRRKEVGSKKHELQNPKPKERCPFSSERVTSWEHLNDFVMLLDDEELEARELHARKALHACSCDYASGGPYGCFKCKAIFPPNSVKMKQPVTIHGRDFSSECVKKLFKAFHFLYTYSVTIDVCSFTLEEFAQSFYDKNSFLLGKVHVALLKLLLSDVELDINNGFVPHSSVSCKFLALLHSVEDQGLKLWKKSLNPLTWTEILRQVFLAAGFGSKKGKSQKETLNKEMGLMRKYGLHPGTLKGELFRCLLDYGNSGTSTSDLAKSSQMAELNLTSSMDELEILISSTLSSDISLFEKISSTTYRLRIAVLTNEEEDDDDFPSDTEVDNNVHNCVCSRSDSECDSNNPQFEECKHITCHKSGNDVMLVHSEVDESYFGEGWLLGLMEGEYSDLSIVEKLDALVALIDLLGASFSIRLEDPARPSIESAASHSYGAGAKIKRSSVYSWVHAPENDLGDPCVASMFRPIDSSASVLNFMRKKKHCGGEENANMPGFGSDSHPMQSIFLGFDRRYNRYWLFLGPCSSFDSGHKRVYFESSEDGHWEVIDSEKDLIALVSVLDGRGKREALLIESLERSIPHLCQMMMMVVPNRMMANDGMDAPLLAQLELETMREDSSSPISDVDNLGTAASSLPKCSVTVLGSQKRGEETQKWCHLQELDAWIWNFFYLDLNAVKHGKQCYFEPLIRCQTCHDLFWRDEKHCRVCHTTFELDFDLEEQFVIHSATCRDKGDMQQFPKHRVLSSQLQALKASLYVLESVMPGDAIVGAWKKSAHRLWIKRLRRASSMTVLLQVATDFVAAINKNWFLESEFSWEEMISSFATIPQTSSALALWLVKLDRQISLAS